MVATTVPAWLALGHEFMPTLNEGSLTVNKAALSVTPDDQHKLYGEAFSAFTGSIVGIQNLDNITATYASDGAAATALVAGSPYAITATLVDPDGMLNPGVLLDPSPG